ncbi:hypothetical protein N7493_008638 [Penicillium malachiteum]|uniref:Uncharacterized protein n=1 Tax=Penicillium malachiteum TaxID=1324776 RepID=A0AAD6MU21_9EURO|nr:hypothetical protein N7493_008638 [Penicillium malachiteum]
MNTMKTRFIKTTPHRVIMARDNHAVQDKNSDVGHRQLGVNLPITWILVRSRIDLERMTVVSRSILDSTILCKHKLSDRLVDSQQSKYDSSSESEPEHSSRHTNRRKSTGGAPKNNRRERDCSCDRVRDNSKSHHNWSDSLRSKGGEILMQAALPLIAAGAAEALRSRKKPGEWKGDKGKQVMKAAVTDGLIKRDPNKSHAHHIVDTTVSGLKEGRPTHEEMSEIQRRAGESRPLSNFKKIAAASALAFAGMEIYDRYGHSRSRKESEGYKDGSSGLKKRSQSVSDDRNRGRGSFDTVESHYRTPRGRLRGDRADHREVYDGRDRGVRAPRYPSDSGED